MGLRMGVRFFVMCLKVRSLFGRNVFAAYQLEATPVICDSRIYMRIARKDGDRRQEMLYCIGK